MAAIAEDGTLKFLALNNVTTGLPITLISTDGGASYSTIFEPGAGEANNVVSSNGKVILHGNFGVDNNIRDYDGGLLTDISITGLGVGTVINSIVYNAIDDVFYATVDVAQDLYKRTAGVWAVVNSAIGFDGAKIIGLFSGEDALYLCGGTGLLSKFSSSINGGITLVDRTASMTGFSALSVGSVVSVTT